MFKTASVVMAPDGNPSEHRATIVTGTLQLTTVVTQMGNWDQAVEVCRELVQKEGVQSISLCPGFTNQAVARVAAAVGEDIPINVTRSDAPGMMKAGEILRREGWLPGPETAWSKPCLRAAAEKHGWPCPTDIGPVARVKAPARDTWPVRPDSFPPCPSRT